MKVIRTIFIQPSRPV